MMPSRAVTFIRWGLLILVLGAWEYTGMHSDRVRFLMGTPSEVVVELWNSAISGEFLGDFTVTGGEALAGLILGTVVGSAAGLLLWLSSTAAAITRPFVFALSNFPVFVVAPLMIVWFGVGLGMKIAFATMATVFVAFNQAFNGAHSVSKDHLDVMRGFGASRWQQFRKVVVPGSLDGVLAGLRVNTGLSLLGAFIGEFVAGDRGLGRAITTAAGLYRVPKAFAGTLGIILLAFILNWLAGLVEKHRNVLIQYLSVPKALRRLQ
jgi:NitT/TauT family transport system permease protein